MLGGEGGDGGDTQVVTPWLCVPQISGWPPAVLDAGQGMAPEARRAWLEEQSRILKQTFW